MADTSIPASELEKAFQDLRNRLDSATSEMGLLRPGDLTIYTVALNTLSKFEIDALLEFTDNYSNPNVPLIFAFMSEEERTSFVRSKSPVALQKATLLGAMGVLYLKQGSNDKGGVVSAFGKVLKLKWQADRTDDNLEDAIYYFRKAVELESSEVENHALRLEDLACTVYERFKKTKSDVDFEETRDAFERAAGLGHRGTPLYLSNLGLVWKERAGMVKEGRDALLEKSIEIHLKALNLLSSIQLPDIQIRYLHRNLAEAYFETYELSLPDPATTLHDSVKSAIANSANRWMLLYELAVQHSKRYNEQGNNSDAEKSIALFHSALEDHPNDPIILCSLAEIYERRGALNGSQQLVSQGISVLEAVVAATPEQDPQFPIRLKTLSAALHVRFEQFGNPEDLDSAILAVEKALGYFFLDKSTRWEYLRLLGTQLLERSVARNQISDLETALTHLQSALNSVGLANQSKALCLYSYGRILQRFSFYEKMDHRLEEAIQSYTEALTLLPTDHYELSALCYNELGNAWTKKCQKTGSGDDLHHAVDSYLQAIAVRDQMDQSMSTATSKREKSMFLVGLGNAHLLEFERWHRIASIDLAISCYQEALEAVNEDDKVYVTRTGSLCHALRLKFALTGDEKLLKHAQNSLVDVINRPKPLPLDESLFLLQCLGGIYFYLASDSPVQSEAISYFDEAASCFRRVLNSGSGDLDSLQTASANLITILVSKYKLTQANGDLLAVVKLVQETMKDALPQKKSMLLHELGRASLVVIEDETGMVAPSLKTICGKLALLTFSLIANEKDHSSPPSAQVGAAIKAATLNFELHGNAREASRLLLTATDLLSQAIMLGPSRSDQLRAVEKFQRIPDLALAMFLEAGEPLPKALQICERGRCFILDRLIDQKSDIPDLEIAHPELAVKFEDLRAKLAQNHTSKIFVPGLMARNLQYLNDCALEYYQTLNLIREQPGFETFLLLPEDLTHIKNYAASGNIVLLNTSTHRSDAILITSEGLDHLPLPNLVQPSDQLWLDMGDFSGLMKWLWEVAACPVLDKLGHTGIKKDSANLPRLWWMTNGWIRVVPIHAAGDHARAMATGEPCSVHDRVISSSIPTLKMLGFSQSKRHTLSNSTLTAEGDQKRALLVHMPVTPNDADLLHVERECGLIEGHLGKEFHVTNLRGPKRSHVVATLETASMAHFACHGIANDKDPSLSRLLFQDWRGAPFNVRFILSQSMPQCQFVYLSACQTGSIKAAKLSKEAIHLSSAFLTAGVPYVVATLQDIEDEISVTVADKFYSYFVEKNSDFSRSAEALHAALTHVRGRVDLFQWAAFIHFGA